MIVEVQDPLLRLAARIDGVTVLARGKPLPVFDLHCPLLSLPLAFGTSLATIPDPTPYLSPPPERLGPWRERIGAQAGLKVGIAWAGNPVHRNDRNRSIPIERLAPLFEVEGPSWFSLQTGPRAAEAAATPELIDLSAALTDFGETAAAIAALDLVIAADTAVAHLAGALGKPVWLMLPFAPDWRWLLGRADSPWYRSMRLFRQARPGEWGPVIAAVRAALAQQLAAPADRGRAAGTRAEPALVDTPCASPGQTSCRMRDGCAARSRSIRAGSRCTSSPSPGIISTIPPRRSS